MWLNLVFLLIGSLLAQLVKPRLKITHTLTVSFLAVSFMTLQLLVAALLFDIPPRNMRGRALPLEDGTRGVIVAFAICLGLFIVALLAERIEARRNQSAHPRRLDGPTAK